MATSGDVTVARDDGQGNVRLHPYMVTLVRWCVSYLWSSATVLLHRLLTTPLQPVTGPKPQPAPRAKVSARAAGTEHLHPEPRVECRLLHQPNLHTMDVIFVHGLYGSLSNTWRQGDWRPKYKTGPQKVPLRNHSKTNACNCRETNSFTPKTSTENICNENKCNLNNIYNTELNDSDMSLNKMNEKLSKKVIPKENDLITEQFYNNTLLDQDNCDTQAKFVSDLFKKENCDTEFDDKNDQDIKYNEINDLNECICNNKEKKCEEGCGCICDGCYSTCWPRDWIKIDFPGARVISINYTSDPYLWRPLWIKENKRLNLYQRAEQMIEQLLDMDVGEKPIIWVAHSKGGLFIKQIYCEAYEAYRKLNKNTILLNESLEPNVNNIDEMSNIDNTGISAEKIDSIIGHFTQNDNQTKVSFTNHTNNIYNIQIHDTKNSYKDENYMMNYNIANNNACVVMNETISYSNIFESTNLNELEYVNVIKNDNGFNDTCNYKDGNGNENSMQRKDLDNGNQINENYVLSSRIEESLDPSLPRRAALWASSRGFMFYSVPHRGSPLADIKTPVTARSVDLLEIAKDCPLVLDLQDRWLRATGAPGHEGGPGGPRVAVRSFVETCRTLMSVLWLRIVSTESADAGIGTLSGVSVDHREICKPSSRQCLLYTELTELIHEALKCRCQ